MERNVIISLIGGYIASLLPVWTWDSKAELVTATLMFSIVSLIALIWIREKTEKIKEALASANVRASKR